MIFGSICSGIEAASAAWAPMGWRAAWFAEIEPFCCALLKHHYPEVPNLGDFTRIGRETEASPVDLLVGGTPCQSFSVAGKRAGLDDPRGILTLEFLALIGRLRPRWAAWENVRGVLSIDGGRTFGAIVGTLAKFGYGWAYRVLDAQYFGVPQRRRRVFVVAYLGDWRRAAAVLFERTSLSGNPPPRREKGEAATADAIAGAVSSKWSKGSGGPAGDEAYNLIAGTLANNGASRPSGQANETDFLIAKPLASRTGGFRQDLDNDPYVTHALRAEGFDASEDGTGRGTPLVFDYRQSGEINPTMRSLAHDASHANGGSHLAVGVRRLTPRECERLQGFPDGYTAVPYRGKLAADGPRYRALGNSMAVPVMRWIGERIQMVEDLRW